ncbi:DUF2058 domain-containing protein [Endozoicomonas sp. Mp262]|uniref:DUF2058 domain-containing protein n=1 Tax=Endozoicomonas sp. Mp262 TaxID=2919499 RepID=UPI0021D86ED3
MSKSLRDQLMKAGLASKQQALKAKTSTKKKKKQAAKDGVATEQELRRIELEKERAAKVERDRELNRQREEEKNRKAILAQVRQLIERNAIAREKGDVGYNFVYEKKVKKIYVTDAIQNKLSRGLLAIAVQDEEFILIPVPVAEKIAERIPEIIVLQNQKGQEEDSVEEEDWYADYQIPDDLMW